MNALSLKQMRLYITSTAGLERIVQYSTHSLICLRPLTLHGTHSPKTENQTIRHGAGKRSYRYFIHGLGPFGSG